MESATGCHSLSSLRHMLFSVFIGQHAYILWRCLILEALGVHVVSFIVPGS